MLLSPTFRDQLGYKVGGKFIFWPRGDEDRKIETTIVGFIDYFPGFQPGKMGLNPDGTALPVDSGKYNNVLPLILPEDWLFHRRFSY